MSDSRSPIIKIGGYLLIGFFTLIIIISFGMPDFISRLGLDQSTVAVVNGEKLHVYDFLRYRDNIYQQYGRNEKLDSYILSQYIGEALIIQEAIKGGFEVSDDKVARYIKSIPYFKNPETGAYDGELFKTFLQRNKFTLGEFHKILKRDLTKEEYLQHLRSASAVSNDDIAFDYATSNSRLKIKFAYLSNDDLKKRFPNKVSVTEAEISDEMAKNKGELKDPKTDRNRFRQKLEEKKLAEAKKEIVSSLSGLASRKASFNESAAALNGRVSSSKEFKAGGQMFEDSKEPLPLTQIEGSKIFREEFFALDKGTASSPIDAANGIYVFTPELREFKKDEPSDAEKKNIEGRLEYQRANTLSQNLLGSIMEKSKITKTQNFDKN